MMLWSAQRAGQGRPERTAEFEVRGEGSLNLDVSLPQARRKNITKLETWGEQSVNTPPSFNVSCPGDSACCSACCSAGCCSAWSSGCSADCCSGCCSGCCYSDWTWEITSFCKECNSSMSHGKRNIHKNSPFPKEERIFKIRCRV